MLFYFRVFVAGFVKNSKISFKRYLRHQQCLTKMLSSPLLNETKYQKGSM